MKYKFTATLPVVCAISLSLLFALNACNNKKKEEVIIVKTPKQVAKPKQTIAMETMVKTTDVEWGSGRYTVQVERAADKSLDIVKDEANDEKYFDNTISLKILREDGTDAISKTFKKENFKAKLNSKLYNSYVLLALIYQEADGNQLKFIASIGEPDPYSENFTNLLVTLNKNGEVNIAPYVIDEKTGDEAILEP